MTNTPAEWRSQGPIGMHAVIYSRPCGWHILLSRTGPTVESRLRPIVIGKACIPYTRPGDELVAQDQVHALTIGLANITDQVEQTCHNL